MEFSEPSDAMRAASAVVREASTFSAGDPAAPPDIATMRQQMAAQELPLPDGCERRDSTIGGVPCATVQAAGAQAACGVLYFHGGGYSMGSPDTHQELAGRISASIGRAVVAADYRLAPEHPCPAALDDALAVYRALLDDGVAAESLVIAGDSAGGGLTLALLQALGSAGLPQPAGGWLLSPWTDLSASGASVVSRDAADPMISATLLAPMAQMYCGAMAAESPVPSPLFGDLAGLPPLLVQVGDDEVLLDDSTRLVERAAAAKLDVSLTVYPGAFHVFQAVPGLPESEHAVAAFAAFHGRVTT